MSRKSVPDRRTEQSKEMNFNSTLHSDGTHKNTAHGKNIKKKKNLKEKNIFVSLQSN